MGLRIPFYHKQRKHLINQTPYVAFKIPGQLPLLPWLKFPGGYNLDDDDVGS